jgi:hypothetical protein
VEMQGVDGRLGMLAEFCHGEVILRFLMSTRCTFHWIGILPVLSDRSFRPSFCLGVNVQALCTTRKHNILAKSCFSISRAHTSIFCFVESFFISQNAV